MCCSLQLGVSEAKLTGSLLPCYIRACCCDLPVTQPGSWRLQRESLSWPSAVRSASAGFCLCLPSLLFSSPGSEWDLLSSFVFTIWEFLWFVFLVFLYSHLSVLCHQNYVSKRGLQVHKNIPWLTEFFLIFKIQGPAQVMPLFYYKIFYYKIISM